MLTLTPPREQLILRRRTLPSLRRASGLLGRVVIAFTDPGTQQHLPSGCLKSYLIRVHVTSPGFLVLHPEEMELFLSGLEDTSSFLPHPCLSE